MGISFTAEGAVNTEQERLFLISIVAFIALVVGFILEILNSAYLLRVRDWLRVLWLSDMFMVFGSCSAHSALVLCCAGTSFFSASTSYSAPPFSIEAV